MYKKIYSYVLDYLKSLDITILLQIWYNTCVYNNNADVHINNFYGEKLWIHSYLLV